MACIVHGLQRAGHDWATYLHFHLQAGHIMQNAGLDEVQAGIKISGRNIYNPRYADDTTLMAESEEELKSLLVSMKEEWKSRLKTQY